MSALGEALRREGLSGALQTLLIWKLWQPWRHRRWVARCRDEEALHPLDLSDASWRWMAPRDLPADWWPTAFPLGREQLASLRDSPWTTEERQALRGRCEAILAGDYRWLMAATPMLGSLPDWHALLDAPGAWSSGPSRAIDYMSESRPGDIRRCWELNRHQHLQILGRGWVLERDPRLAECAARHLEDWIRRNPPGFGPNWIQAQEVALRAISWCWARQLCHDAPAFTPELRDLIDRSLACHQRFLEREVCAFGKWTHNHLISELAGIHTLAALFPKWRSSARLECWSRRMLNREAAKQIWPEGLAGELSTAYMFFVLETLAGVRAIAKESWRGSVLDRRLVAMGRAAAWLLRPDSSLPQVGDSDSARGWLLAEPVAGRPESPGREAVAQLPWILAGEAPAPWIQRQPAAEWRWLFGPNLPEVPETTPSLGQRTPTSITCLFREGGLWIRREGRDSAASWLLFRGGATKRRPRVLQSHHHADLLSFEYVHRGHLLLVDPGTYAYSLETEQRRAYRSSRVHNGLWVEDWEPCDFRDQRFGVWRLPDSRLLESGERVIRMGFSQGAVGHERRLEKTEGGLRGEDHVRRPPCVRAGLGFQLAPGIEVEECDNGWAFPALGLALRLSPESTAGWILEIEEGRVSWRYGQWEAAPRLRLWLPPAPTCRAVWTLEESPQ